MVTKSDIINCIENPLEVGKISAHEIRELLNTYPYFEALHFIYLRKLFIDNDIRFDSQLEDSAMHISNRKLLYNYLNYEHKDEEENTITDMPVSSIDYFTIEENPNQKKSLQLLAQKLKEARLARSQEHKVLTETKVEPQKKEDIATPANEDTNYFTENNNNFSTTLEDISSLANEINGNIDNAEKKTSEISIDPEIRIKQLIKDKKYSEALEILKSINLINPKKSVYFAVQIKYLETIIDNNK